QADSAQVVQDFGADPAALVVGADDRDRSRLEERPQRGRGCHLRTPSARRLEPRGRLQIERDVEDALLQPLRQGETRLQEHVHHCEVVAEHVRVERPEASVAPDLGEALEHPGAEAVALQRIGDREGHLGAVGHFSGPVVAGNPAQRRAALGDDQDVVGPAFRRGRHDPPRLFEPDAARRHEPEVQAAFGQAAEEIEDRAGIGLPGGAEADGGSVTQDDVGFEIRTSESDGHGNRKSTGEAIRKRPDFKRFAELNGGTAGNPAACSGRLEEGVMRSICRAAVLTCGVMTAVSAALPDPPVTPVSGRSWLHTLGVDYRDTSFGRGAGRYGPSPSDAAGDPEPVPGTVAARVTGTGADLYSVNCPACHPAEGTGAPPEIKSALPAVQGSTLQQIRGAVTKADLYARIEKGGQKMPARAHLQPADVDVLYTYLTKLAGTTAAPQPASEAISAD